MLRRKATTSIGAQVADANYASKWMMKKIRSPPQLFWFSLYVVYIDVRVLVLHWLSF